MNRQSLRVMFEKMPGQKGMVAAVVLIVLMLLLGLGSAMLRISISEWLLAANYTDGIAAQYLAEAGAKLALSRLAKDPSWAGGKGSLGEGHYKVYVNTSAQKLVSTGTVRRASRQISASYTLAYNSGEKVPQDRRENSAAYKPENTLTGSGQLNYNYRVVVTAWSD
ncbi:putative membrane protein [Propionispora sp. 2/2-37]|uniref:hypothetical protein n=1 Tax=Propionispora sp. 2/2-37 TaxID=1677858 RepID=UPI0006BB8D4F|nr:hypothetical protein [Propionispora sp. 2/2-37]CUH94090.1 putative membrane protein [Propionispora sp. 2/2-37]